MENIIKYMRKDIPATPSLDIFFNDDDDDDDDGDNDGGNGTP